jgi:nicotinamide-nucleotide amidase
MNEKAVQKSTTAAAKLLIRNGLTIALAESCTGGLISNLFTNVPGSSAFFNGAVVAYQNNVKRRVLQVKARTLKAHGAVSKDTAREMARGVRRLLKSDIGLSVTGIAGPGGAKPEKPVGTVHLAITDGRRIRTKELGPKDHPRRPSRITVKENSAKAALKLLTEFIKES